MTWAELAKISRHLPHLGENQTTMPSVYVNRLICVLFTGTVRPYVAFSM